MIPDFATRLLAWFDRHGRHDLPWQHPRTPYRVWLSEVMLQQTQVAVVIPYFLRFVAAMPSLPALAAAPLDEVLALWSGLGYYSRARNLHAAARLCTSRHDGELPDELDALIALPGIGRSTAGAILAQAWGQRTPILDGNARRVLARHAGIAGWPGSPAVEKRLWTLAESLLPATRMADYTQAQMDLGATLCTRHAPRCDACPVAADCVARIEGRTAELPTPRPSRAVPLRHAVMLVASDPEGRILLQRRPPTGVWASLWSLPQFDERSAAQQWSRAHLDGDWRQAREAGPVMHGFTHYRLRITPLHWRDVRPRDAVRDNDCLRWARREELASIGLPAPVRRLLVEER